MNRRDFLSLTAAAAALPSLGSTAWGAAPIASKKGCGITTRDRQWAAKVKELRLGWVYTWGAELPPQLPRGVDFAPMIWGDGDNAKRAELLESLRERGAAGEITALMGFNEPDQKKQGNMTLERVVDLWPELMGVGVPLLSPGCVHPDREWMDAFMKEVERRDLRVDAVAVHSYGGPSVEALVKRLEAVHQRFGRPLWITEFAVGDWEAKTVRENRHSARRIEGFLREAIPALDSLACVQRYAWFPAETTSAPLGTSALFDPEGNLTPLGEIYAGA